MGNVGVAILSNGLSLGAVPKQIQAPFPDNPRVGALPDRWAVFLAGVGLLVQTSVKESDFQFLKALINARRKEQGVLTEAC